MKLVHCFCVFAVAGAAGLHATAGGDIPTAPEGYRRPADWKPVLYPKDLHQIARDHSAEVMARARGTLSDASDVL